MPNFDEATRDAAAMFENEQTVEETVQNDAGTATETPPEQNEESGEQVPAAEQEAPVAEQAIEAAEAATQAAVDKNAEVERLTAENQRLMEQNQLLQNSITQMSEQQEQSIVSDTVEDDVPPTLDVEALAFDDPETARAKQKKFAEDMAAFARKAALREVQPFIDQAKEAERIKEKETLVADLAAIPETADVRELLPQIEHIIKVNPVLASDNVSMKDKLIIAYAMAKGVNVINNPHKDPTTDELMQLYDKMPDFQDAIEKRRIGRVKDSQQVPTHSASSGAVNAALNFDKKPQTLDEATESVKKLFR